jgi:hypothetical protein
MKKNDWKWPLGLLLFVIGSATFVHYQPHTSSDVASWVQAVGSIGAIIGAFQISNQERRAAAIAREEDVAESRQKTLFLASLIIEKTRDIGHELTAIAATMHYGLYANSFIERLRDQRDAIRAIELEKLDQQHAVAVISVRDLVNLMIAKLSLAPVMPPGQDGQQFLSQSFANTTRLINQRLEEVKPLPA